MAFALRINAAAMKSVGQTSSKQPPLGIKSQKRALLGEQRGKQLLASDRPDHAILAFPANGAAGEADAAGLRNEISSYLFEYLDGFHIPTYYVGKFSDREMIVRRSDPLALEVLVLNHVTPELVERYQLPAAKVLEFPIIEHYAVTADGKRTLANEHHLFALDILTPEEFKQVNRIASKTNAVLRGLSDRRRLALRDLRLYFGKQNGQLLLVDELSPVTCRFVSAEKPANGASQADPLTASAMRELRDRLLLKA